MKKLLILGLLFFFLLIIQCLLEGSVYVIIFEVLSDIVNDKLGMSFIEVLKFIKSYSGYRFGITVIPYLILTLIFSKLIVKRYILYIGVLNLVVNAVIIGFIVFYLEPILSNKKIFFTTLFVGTIILILGIVLQRSSLGGTLFLFKNNRK